MSTYHPIWATKPRHKKEVIVTSQGWALKETGELLVRVRDLDLKLAELGLYQDEETEVVEVKKDEAPVLEKRKAGRPKKVKVE